MYLSKIYNFFFFGIFSIFFWMELPFPELYIAQLLLKTIVTMPLIIFIVNRKKKSRAEDDLKN